MVEVDRESVDYLNEHYLHRHGKILHQDFLRMDIDAHFNGSFSVIGNYLITSLTDFLQSSGQ